MERPGAEAGAGDGVGGGGGVLRSKGAFGLSATFLKVSVSVFPTMILL